MARPFLLVISFLVSSILPKYLQDFHASSPFLLMVYSSVLVSFTLRSLSLSFCGMVFCFCIIAKIILNVKLRLK